MESLKAALLTLANNTGNNFNDVSACATYLGMNRPISVRALIERVMPVLTVINIWAKKYENITTLDISSVHVGNLGYIWVKAIDQNGHEMSGIAIDFSVSDPAVGSISPDHNSTDGYGITHTTFTAKSEGTVTITAVGDGFGKIIGNISLTVNPPSVLTTINISAESGSGIPESSVVAGQYLYVKVTAFNQYNEKLSGIAIDFSVSDPAVGSISPDQVITARENDQDAYTIFWSKAEGTETITATSGSGSVQASTKIMVTPSSLNHLSISSTSTVAVGNAVQITVDAYDQNGHEMSGIAIVFSISDPAVGSISPDHVTSGDASHPASTTFTAKTEGTATITATSGSAQTSVGITVTPNTPPQKETGELSLTLQKDLNSVGIYKGNSIDPLAFNYKECYNN